MLVVVAARLTASLADVLVLAVTLSKTVSIRRNAVQHHIRTPLLTMLILDGTHLIYRTILAASSSTTQARCTFCASSFHTQVIFGPGPVSHRISRAMLLINIGQMISFPSIVRESCFQCSRSCSDNNIIGPCILAAGHVLVCVSSIDLSLLGVANVWAYSASAILISRFLFHLRQVASPTTVQSFSHAQSSQGMTGTDIVFAPGAAEIASVGSDV